MRSYGPFAVETASGDTLSYGDVVPFSFELLVAVKSVDLFLGMQFPDLENAGDFYVFTFGAMGRSERDRRPETLTRAHRVATQTTFLGRSNGPYDRGAPFAVFVLRARGASMSSLRGSCAAMLAWVLLGPLGCGGDDAVVSDGSSSGSEECVSDPSCDAFAIACSNGEALYEPGCRLESGCRGEDELPASLCSGAGFDSVTVVTDMPPDDAPTTDAGSEGGSSGGSSGGGFLEEYCDGTVRVISGPNDSQWTVDCADLHQLCKEDDLGDTTCVAPTIGDECYGEGSLTCTADQLGAVCEGNTITEIDLDCLGGGACTGYVSGTINTIACGLDEDYRAYSLPDTPCGDHEGKASCSLDRTAVHLCVGGYWTVDRHCDPGACWVIYENPSDLGTVVCSHGGYGIGDPCDDWSADRVGCSGDRTLLLECVNGKTAVRQSCGAGQECRRGLQNGGTILHCAPAGYVVGDLCHFPEGALLCDATNSAVLACRGEVMELETTCEAGTTCQPAVSHGVPIGECR